MGIILRVSFILLIQFGYSSVFSQSISPKVINNGGGFSSAMDWSMGESVSIAYFSVSNYHMNTGVLQPFSNEVTNINDFGTTLFGEDIIMGPNPTLHQLHIKTKFNQPGDLSFRIMDAKSTTLNTIDVGVVVGPNEYKIDLETYPTGVIYVYVIYKTLKNEIKSGIYKIIKL